MSDPMFNVSTAPIQGVVVPAPPRPAKRSYSRFYGRHEVLDGEYKMSQKFVAELLGTALFVFGVIASGVCFSGTYPLVSILGGSFMGGVIIYLFGRVSGAHFNPAVSLALLMRQQLTGREFLLYIAAQLIGSIIGSVMLGLIRHGKFKVMGGSEIPDYLIYTAGGHKKNAWCYISALISEIIGTFILIMFILASCERDNYLGPMLGLAFASVLISLNVIGGNISSCSLNPARSFGPALVQAMAKGNKNPIEQIWIYIAGPIIGAILAALVWPIFLYGE
jgi:MIP family channel proteins